MEEFLFGNSFLFLSFFSFSFSFSLASVVRHGNHRTRTSNSSFNRRRHSCLPPHSSSISSFFSCVFPSWFPQFFYIYKNAKMTFWLFDWLPDNNGLSIIIDLLLLQIWWWVLIFVNLLSSFVWVHLDILFIRFRESRSSTQHSQTISSRNSKSPTKITYPQVLFVY